MLWWDGKFLDKLESLGVDLEFYLRYVDDSNMSGWALAPGTRLVDGQLSILEELVVSDQLIPADKRTAAVLRSIANEICPGIIMQEDVPSNHSTGKLPILDLEVWVSNTRIYHSFYKKPMATKKVVHAKSALPTKVKRSILLEEGSRRLRNCSPELEWETKVFHLNRLSSEMKNSGHSQSFRSTILHRVAVKYLASLSNHQEEKKNMYRNKKERLEQKQTNKALTGNDTWFRKGGFTSTLTVPSTPGGFLASKVEDNLMKGRQPNGTKTKVIEGNGMSSRFGLTKSNQFPRDNCEREDCAMCVNKEDSDKRTHCDISNVGYEGDCLRCNLSVYKYVGETSRTGYTRIREHLADYRAAATANLPPQPEVYGPDQHRKPVKSWMWEHTRDVHGGQTDEQGGISDYKFHIANTFKKCLQRQIDEGLRIKRKEAEGCILLNGKNEFYTPRLVEPVFRQL